MKRPESYPVLASAREAGISFLVLMFAFDKQFTGKGADNPCAWYASKSIEFDSNS